MGRRSWSEAIGGGTMDVGKLTAGLRVLAVDDDQVCLKILEMQLRYCKYNVTAVTNAETALEMLRARKDGDQFDLVISDVHMPDMDGFKLLELVGLEMDIPVIMLSANEEMETMMKGIKHGACDYLLKPVHLDRLKTLWMHVLKKSMNDDRRNHIGGTDKDAEAQEHNQPRGTEDEKDGGADGTNKCSRKNRKGRDGPEEDSENAHSSMQKKQRIKWSGPLHSKFVDVVQQIGIDRAVPKKIWKLMNVDGINRDNVASHLQKYRAGLKKFSVDTHKQSNPFPAETESWRRDWNYINMSRLAGSPSGTGMHHRLLHSHQPVQPMNSQRNLASPLIIGPAGHGGNLPNGAVQDVSKLTAPGNSYGNTSHGGLTTGNPLFASPSVGYFENVPNCVALNSTRPLAYSITGNSFANIPNGTQPLDAGLCNPSKSWNPNVLSMFPGHGHNIGFSGGPLQGNGLAINQLSRHAASSGQMTTVGQEFQNQMAAPICANAPAVGFGGEQIALFNLGCNTNSTSLSNHNSAPAGASSFGSAPPSIQIDNYDMQTQMLNGGGGSGILPDKDGAVDQPAFGDLMGMTDTPIQISDLDDLVDDWLNQDYYNPSAGAVHVQRHPMST